MEMLAVFLVFGFFALIIILQSVRENRGKTHTVNFWSKRYDERLDEITSEDRGTWSERDLIGSLLDY